MASSKLSYTQGTPTDNNTWTFSAWIKKSHFGSSEGIIFSAYDSASSMTNLRMNGSGDSCTLAYWDYQGSYTGRLVTSRSLRDANGWYHVVVVWDSDNATPGDRMKMYINGVEETAFGTDTNPSSGQSTVMNTASQVLEIGAANSADYFNGLMSNIVFVDGTALAPTEFGEVDSTSGIWKFKPPSGITYGNNGFWLKGENSSALGTDSSGEGNNLTVAGSPTQSIDTPSNVFCTFNPLDGAASGTFSNGNTTFGEGSGTWSPTKSTLAMLGTTGKFYGEFKGVSGTNLYWGVYDVDVARGSVQSEMDNNRLVYHSGGEIIRTLLGEANVSVATYTTANVIGCAVDKDSGVVKFYKDGTLIHTETDTDITNKNLCFGTQVLNTTINANFGTGYFGSTAISSAGTSSSGDDSVWEEDCPTGHYGLNTKNLNTYG